MEPRKAERAGGSIDRLRLGGPRSNLNGSSGQGRYQDEVGRRCVGALPQAEQQAPSSHEQDQRLLLAHRRNAAQAATKTHPAFGYTPLMLAIKYRSVNRNHLPAAWLSATCFTSATPSIVVTAPSFVIRIGYVASSRIDLVAQALGGKVVAEDRFLTPPSRSAPAGAETSGAELSRSRRRLSPD